MLFSSVSRWPPAGVARTHPQALTMPPDGIFSSRFSLVRTTYLHKRRKKKAVRFCAFLCFLWPLLRWIEFGCGCAALWQSTHRGFVMDVGPPDGARRRFGRRWRRFLFGFVFIRVHSWFSLLPSPRRGTSVPAFRSVAPPAGRPALHAGRLAPGVGRPSLRAGKLALRVYTLALRDYRVALRVDRLAPRVGQGCQRDFTTAFFAVFG